MRNELICSSCGLAVRGVIKLQVHGLFDHGKLPFKIITFSISRGQPGYRCEHSQMNGFLMEDMDLMCNAKEATLVTDSGEMILTLKDGSKTVLSPTGFKIFEVFDWHPGFEEFAKRSVKP